mmetsp:Transcript_119355/g.166548  ORF Transcript_119355/g.166548 Transcript_119355/m.166548 type:complete len:385 (-) Transcript_119355:291-1445(-)
MGNTGSDFTSVNSSVEEQELGTNFLVDFVGGLSKHELVVEGIAATDHFDVVEVVRVDSGEADTAVVHLSGEDLITVEVVAEDAAVGVGIVVSVGVSNINEISEKSVHGVVLLLDIVKVLSVLIDAVVTEHILQKKEAIVVSVLDAGGVVEHTNVRVDHLVISNKEKSRDVNRSLRVGSLGLNTLGKSVEVLVDLIDESLVVKVTSTDNNDVVTVVVGSVVVSEGINIQVLDLIAVSLNRLTHHVLSVDIEVNVLQGGLFVSGVVGFVVFAQFLLEKFELASIESAVGDSVTKKSDGLVHVSLEYLKLESSALTAWLGSVAGTHGFDFLSKVVLGALRGTTEEHLLESVGCTSGLESVLAGTSTNVNTDGRNLTVALLSDNADAV